MSSTSTSCPWWNSNNQACSNSKNQTETSYSINHKCNIYGLHQYLLSHIESNGIDLSFWPINDHDVQYLMMKLARSIYMGGIDKNKKNNKQEKQRNICYVEELKLHSCTYLTDVGVCHLARYWNERGSGNRDFDFTKEGDADVKEDESSGDKVNGPIKMSKDYLTLIRRCANSPLLSLDLSNCRHVTDVACKSIGVHFTKLQVLNLSDCVLITDVGLKHIMTGCKYLHEIHLRNLVNLQDEGLGYIGRNLILMKCLRIIG